MLWQKWADMEDVLTCVCSISDMSRPLHTALGSVFKDSGKIKSVKSHGKGSG